MKVTKLVGAVIVVTTVGTVGLTITPATTMQAQAKTTLATFPKSIRGTWYNRTQYGKKHHYHAVRFTKKGFAWQANVATKLGGLAPLHAHKAPFSGSKTSKHLWLYAVKKQGFTKVGWWNNTVTLELGGYYKVISKRYKGKSIRVLECAIDLTKPRYYVYYYPNKKIATHFQMKVD
ncbi:hypothetical protein [Lactiplantibacillus daowaiensis]|uniref:Extracellular protein n=1 Tax=Lactiplantibacillus daowaiensis TaxID=2559918 RepID=A0ABW1RXK1_9LACO|nr:hypothetical protein [Lactiplantibacillus daowaiensis]